MRELLSNPFPCCVGLGLFIGAMLGVSALSAEEFSRLRGYGEEATEYLRVSRLEKALPLQTLSTVSVLSLYHNEYVCHELGMPFFATEQESAMLARFMQVTTRQGEPIELRPSLDLLESLYSSAAIWTILP